jgi:CheY-like chemotaxis protein
VGGTRRFALASFAFPKISSHEQSSLSMIWPNLPMVRLCWRFSIRWRVPWVSPILRAKARTVWSPLVLRKYSDRSRSYRCIPRRLEESASRMRDSLACPLCSWLYPSTIMATPNQCPKRVLVLDDDASMAQTAVLILSRLGYEAQSETNPGKSIRRILDNEFDLLLTDYRMPGLNGFQVAQTLRTMGSMVTIILHTGEDGAFDSDDLRLLGILGVIKKPLSMDEFNLAFSRILHSNQN